MLRDRQSKFTVWAILSVLMLLFGQPMTAAAGPNGRMFVQYNWSNQTGADKYTTFVTTVADAEKKFYLGIVTADSVRGDYWTTQYQALLSNKAVVNQYKGGEGDGRQRSIFLSREKASGGSFTYSHWNVKNCLVGPNISLDFNNAGSGTVTVKVSGLTQNGSPFMVSTDQEHWVTSTTAAPITSATGSVYIKGSPNREISADLCAYVFWSIDEMPN